MCRAVNADPGFTCARVKNQAADIAAARLLCRQLVGNTDGSAKGLDPANLIGREIEATNKIIGG